MVVCCYVFFFKQKTAYEMRISDWSSDVCSSDLGREVHDIGVEPGARSDDVAEDVGIGAIGSQGRLELLLLGGQEVEQVVELLQIGRASCRERVCQYV